MPHRPPHPCLTPGCGALVHGPGRHCPDHFAESRKKVYAKKALLHTARWQRLRERVLSRQPLCADPFGVHAARREIVAATDVDHILGRDDRPDLRWREDNLQGLCRSCHSRKTRME